MGETPVKRGDILAGKYRVESVLGVGGMGVVVAATHLELLEPRAIKLMLPEAQEQPEWVERFVREARAVARLQSEHVARVHDVGHLDDGSPYMVMEYLAGSDLKKLLRERGRVPVAEAASYALQVCEALAEAHAVGIVHRDLKLANLFLTTRRDGSLCLKVLDFGISKVSGGDDVEITTTQAVMGSPTYMSPEQMRSARSVDARSDVWSMGVILHRLITGEPPFRAENLTELVALVLSTRPPPASSLVPEVPPAFDELLSRCLERDLERRYASVAELAAALAPFAPEAERGSVDRCARLLSTSGRPHLSARRSPAPLAAEPARPPAPSIPSLPRLTAATVGAVLAGLCAGGAAGLFHASRLAPPAAVPAAPPAIVAAAPPPPPSPAPPPSPPPEPAPRHPERAQVTPVRPVRPRPPVPAPPPPPAPSPALTAAHRVFGADD
jgi:serine/threonine-protein kinase